MYDLVSSSTKKDVFKVEITKHNRTFGMRLYCSLASCISLPLSSLYTSHFISLLFYPFTFSFLCFTLFLNHSPFSFAFFLVSVSISLSTPTRTGIACYTRRIGPCTQTLRCKSFKENIKVFLRQACIISELGCSLCSCPGTGPLLQFYCCSAVASCFGRKQGRNRAGRRD